MKRRAVLTLLPCFLLLASTAVSAVVPLKELLDNGTLTLAFTSTGGHSQHCMSVKATHTGSAFVTTRIEPGQTLLAADPTEQDILVTQEVILALHPNQTVEREVYGFCFQSLDAGPQAGSSFSLGPMATGMLWEVANYLNKHRHIDPLTQQQAIWVVSDCHPLSSIRRYDEVSQELAKMIADGLDLEESWYTTQHAQTADHLFTEHVQRITATLPFEVSDYAQLTIVIYNSQNRPVKYLVRSTRYGPGSYTQPLDLHVDRWPRGSYELAFESAAHGRIQTRRFDL